MQSIYEDVARDTNRGHTVEAVKECFVLAKDAGFKVSASVSVCLGFFGFSLFATRARTTPSLRTCWLRFILHFTPMNFVRTVRTALFLGQ